MTDLNQALRTMGLLSLELTTSEQQQIQQLIDNQAAFYAKVVRQKTDKLPHDLALGLLTKCHQQALANFQATAATISRVQSVFAQTVGREQAQKFSTSSESDVLGYTTLWFMAQGYTGIDFSYANDHANETAIILAESPAVSENDPNVFRSRFMQAYYVGRHAADAHSGEGNAWLSRLKRLFRRNRSKPEQGDKE